MKLIGTKINLLFLLVMLFVCQSVYTQTNSTFQTSDNKNLYYTTLGNGSLVLLLSGGPGYASDYLQPIAVELAKTHQTILIDQRGTGKSKLDHLNPGTLNLKRSIADIEELRSHLKQEKITILGHSWGGLLAMAYASEYPKRIDKLILIGSGGITAESFKYLEANIKSRLLPSDLEAIAFWSEPERFAKDPARADYELFRAAAPAYVFERKNALKLIEQTTPDKMDGRVRQIITMGLFKSNYDLRPKLKNFKRPVLIIQGRQDIIGESTAYQIDETLLDSKLIFIEQSGHFPWIEQTDSFFDAVMDFLNPTI